MAGESLKVWWQGDWCSGVPLKVCEGNRVQSTGGGKASEQRGWHFQPDWSQRRRMGAGDACPSGAPAFG